MIRLASVGDAVALGTTQKGTVAMARFVMELVERGLSVSLPFQEGGLAEKAVQDFRLGLPLLRRQGGLVRRLLPRQ